MSFLPSISKLATGLWNTGISSTNILNQVRSKYANKWMIRDVKRRELTAEHAVDRLRLITIKRNRILPVELRNNAAEEIHNGFPRDSCFVRIRPRCMYTSRPRGTVKRFHLSRIMFRHLADYNKLSGIQRAMW